MKNIRFVKLVIIIINIIVISRIIFIYSNKEYYILKRDEILNKYISPNYAPRGRIIDAKGNILVDNKMVNMVVFRNYYFNKDEIVEIINKLSNILSLNCEVSELNLRKYYYFLNEDLINERIDDNVYKEYRLKKINTNTFYNYKLSLITDDEINSLNKTHAYLYNIITNGYLYDDKIIKKDITDEELTLINEANIKGIRIEPTYVRVYNYDTTLNQLFGSIGNIQKEKLNYYLDKGYSQNDIVGVSFLEEYYDDYLKGTPKVYKIKDNNEIELVSDYTKGNDLVLSVDIDLQLKVESILKSEINIAKKYPSSKYYNGSYIMISDNLGKIKVIAGYKYDNGLFLSDAIGNIVNSYTVGSVVKGASQSVAYINNAITRDKLIKDSCVKLYGTNPKCSWKNLGFINDIDALAMSSNYYQFINAIKVSGQEYQNNMKFNVTEDDFTKYRNVFKMYGLGSNTGIEIKEEIGLTGSKISGDLLLNLSIGQYDTYTPIMLNNYISTIANSGTRYNMSLGDYFIDSNGFRLNIEKHVLDTVKIDNDDMIRIQKGFNEVIKRGTGAGYLNHKYTGAGKTGTSETTFNGYNTLTKSFVMYVPYDEPIYNISIVSPNLIYRNSVNKYNYPLNSRLSKQITNILFEN